MSSIGSHSGNQRPVPHQQAPLAVPVIIIFSCEYPAAILTVPLTDHRAVPSRVAQWFFQSLGE